MILKAVEGRGDQPGQDHKENEQDESHGAQVAHLPAAPTADPAHKQPEHVDQPDGDGEQDLGIGNGNLPPNPVSQDAAKDNPGGEREKPGRQRDDIRLLQQLQGRESVVHPAEPLLLQLLEHVQVHQAQDHGVGEGGVPEDGQQGMKNEQGSPEKVFAEIDHFRSEGGEGLEDEDQREGKNADRFDFKTEAEEEVDDDQEERAHRKGFKQGGQRDLLVPDAEHHQVEGVQADTEEGETAG